MAVLLLSTATEARAQELKFQGPIKLLVGFPAGGQSDILTRLVADKLKDQLGRPVVVENRTGAAGRIAVEATKSAPPDGSTLVVANIAQMCIAPLIYPDLAYDPEKDFTPIIRAADFQIALVTGKQTGATDFKALVAWLKANPGKASSGNPGIGSVPHLYGFELGRALDLKLTAIPYRGGVPIGAAIMQGELAMGWAGIADFIENHRIGKLTIVAVTGSARSAQLKDTPTFLELGYPGLAANGWIGVLGPKGMDPALTGLLYREFAAALAEPAIAEKLVTFGFLPAGAGPEALARLISEDLKRWRLIVAASGIKP